MRGEEGIAVRSHNVDPQKSAMSCGCDEGAKHPCEQHPKGAWTLFSHLTSDFSKPLPSAVAEYEQQETWAKRASPGLFPDSAQGRKDHPVFTGFLMYFPDAIAAVARVSKKGNDQHNPGQKLHWAREKSTDQLDTATRHMMDHGTGNTKDTDGEYHLAKAAWRNLAELQLTIERDREGK